MSLAQLTVVLPIYNGFDLVEACLRSLIEPELDPSIHALILVDDASPDPRIGPLLDRFEALDSRVHLRKNSENLGYLATINQVLSDLDGAVILLNSDTRVGQGWATRMHQGAQRYPRLGVLTPLSNNATFSTLPGFPGDSDSAITEENFADAEQLIATRLGSHYPLAPTGMGFCFYISPLALRIGRGFDPVFEPGYEEENDLSMRLRAHGLQCRIATDVLVFHAGGGSFGEAKQRLQYEHYQLIQRVHPCYDATVKEWFRLADSQSLLQQGFTDRRLKVLLDGEILGQTMTGVVRYALTMIDLCRSAAATSALHLTVVVNDSATALFWSKHYPDVEWRTYSELRDQPCSLNPEFHIYHVVNANISIERILTLCQRSRRFVFTLHDLIAFENPAYWGSGEEFLAYRQRLRTVVHLADCVLCISDVTAEDAREQLDLGSPELEVFPNPLEHLGAPASNQAVDKDAFPTILIVGTDFCHKNLIESVRLFADTLLDHPLQPNLVLVGPEVADGGTLRVVRQLIEGDQRLVQKVKLLGSVSDERLHDLYRQAVGCLYLSLQEGFGYIPYEAARYGCATLVANTSVYQSAPDGVAVAPYSCDSTRRALLSLVDDSQFRAANLAYWQGQLRNDQHREHAVELLSVYRRVLAASRTMHKSYWADLIATNLLSQSSLVSYQISFSEAAKQLGRRGLSGFNRRVRGVFRGLTS